MSAQTSEIDHYGPNHHPLAVSLAKPGQVSQAQQERRPFRHGRHLMYLNIR
jgi:hypothetical protein